MNRWPEPDPGRDEVFPGGDSPDPARSEAAPVAGARWEITEGTAWVSSSAEPPHTYVARPPDQGPLVLTGPAHDLWTVWVEGADFEQGVARMQQRYDADPARIRTDAWSLAQQLMEAGVLRLSGH